MSMRRWGWPVLLALSAGSAWGQTKADIMAAVGEELTAYVGCLESHTRGLAQSSIPKGTLLSLADEDAIITKALAACRNARGVLVDALQAPPLNASADEAAAAAQNLDDQLRSEMALSVRDAVYGNP
jgi:hypothetical protein